MPLEFQHPGIYCIRNTISGRRYVGSALNIRQRWYGHRSLLLNGIHHSSTLRRSWLKHGESAFIFEVLEIVTDASKLIEREQYWINELNSACPKTGFNVSPTAGNCCGVKHSNETREKMSVARKGIKKSPSGAESIRNALRIRNVSPEMRSKVRASKLQLYSSPERREQLRAQALKMWKDRRDSGGPLGFPHTEAAKMKISIAKKGNMSDQHKVAIAASNKRRAENLQVFGPAIHR